MKIQSYQFAALLLGFCNSVAAATVRYVDLNSPSPAPPYTAWSSAATNLQDAIDAAFPGDQIVVTNGAYQAGGRVVSGTMTNRVAVTVAVSVQSVNGPSFTSILGGQLPGMTNGDSAIRCLYLCHGASLSGFTLTNGATRATGHFTNEMSGGGAWCADATSMLSNCVISGNACKWVGAGVYGGTLKDCVISRNVCLGEGEGAGACASVLSNCTLSFNRNYEPGSACAYSLLSGCLLNSNLSTKGLGAAFRSALTACVVRNNEHGGASSSVLTDCLIISNALVGADQCASTNCTFVSDGLAPGASGGTLANCILFGRPPNAVGQTNRAINYSCTFPLPSSGSGNFTNPPRFVDAAAGDFHLQASSPCINAGNNAFVASATDFDNNPRVKGMTVDVGAYEVQSPSSVISYAWLEDFGLTIDDSVDSTDTDGDGMNNWQEWIAGTDPTNKSSALALISVSNSSTGATVVWKSVANRVYYVEQATNLLFPFSCIQSNIAGKVGTTSFKDWRAGKNGRYSYRVGVQ